MDRSALAGGLAQLGPAAALVTALDRRVEKDLSRVGALSELTSQLALSYLERIRHPLGALTLEVGVALTTRGYLAHMAVEADPAAYGALAEMPVLGSLPDLRRGRPPQDLLTRVIKATRRNFALIRALPEEVWAGYLLCATAHAHQTPAPPAGDGETPRMLDTAVVDGLLRFGWVLRQVDLRYGLSPGPSPGPSPA